MRLIFDGHLDIAMNALVYERDQTLELAAIRGRELPGVWHKGGTATVSLPQMRRAGVAVCCASVLARARPGIEPTRAVTRENIDWPSADMAYASAQGQLAYYRLLEGRGEVRVIVDRAELEEHWRQWGQADGGRRPVGVILMMEGADPIVESAQLEQWWRQGLRMVSLGHYGPGRYAMGTAPAESDGLTPLGRELLKEMAGLRMALDLTHLSDASFAEALDRSGELAGVCATHSNCRALAGNTRQLTDGQLRQIIERDGVVGAVAHNAMIRWVDGKEPGREDVGLEQLAEHIDHVCQLAGNVRHAAIGSDLDGGFGTEHMPREIESIADLHKLEPLLAARGYSDTDLDGIFHGNWLAFWRRVLATPGR